VVRSRFLAWRVGLTISSPVRLGSLNSPNVGEGAFSQTQTLDSTHFPCDSRTYNALKFHFSATVGEESEVEVALV
jgi:hypothetical protein